MQQASTGKPLNDSDPSGSSLPQNSVRNRFVINLCGSTTPVSLTPPDHAGLKRFTFFVSRRREEGRERFRLHMGYFDSQEDAERLLDIVREIYPGAWAGLAPGQRLRAQAEAATQAAVNAPPPAPAAIPPAVVAPAVAAAPVAAAPVEAAPVIAVAAEASVAEAPSLSPSLSLMPDQGRRVSELAAIMQDNEAAARALSNVRAAIASLEDSTTSTPTLSPIPELRPAMAAKAPAAAETARELTASATLRVLEAAPDTASQSTVRQPALPTTDDAAAAKATASGKPRDEKTAYAVQLLWSVQPIDIEQIPQLAIFSAYTLYGAEGNRDGRRWYGVRLGFFTDAVSAKQVAHYVRSDFSTVSVVPVTVRERERAKLAAMRPDATPVTAVVASAAAANTAAASTAAANVAVSGTGASPVTAGAKLPGATGFEFIEDNKPQVPARPLGNAPAARGARVAPGKRAKLRPGRAAMAARTKPKAMTLEETLEILGAGQLQMDDGRRPLINNDGRAAAADASRNKPSRFGRLLERLSERLGS